MRLLRASSPRPSQLRWEHLSTMYTGGAEDLLFAFCSQLVAGDLPLEARPWFGGARLVAMLKDVDEDGHPIPTASSGGVRPIAMGEVLRKLVGKMACKQASNAGQRSAFTSAPTRYARARPLRSSKLGLLSRVVQIA
jgi:hypothetical protein